MPDRKRLEVARALATEPKLLLLDEVMAGLRPTETDRMVAILRELNRETGLTILLIEHVMRAVMALAPRILVLHHGAAIARGHAGGGGARSGGGRILSRRGGGSDAAASTTSTCSTATPRRSTASRSRSPEGAIVAIVGANGAGKTSLIRTIAGMHRPARGRIRFAAPTSPAGRATASAISASARSPRAARCFPP